VWAWGDWDPTHLLRRPGLIARKAACKRVFCPALRRVGLRRGPLPPAGEVASDVLAVWNFVAREVAGDLRVFAVFIARGRLQWP
jgi:hypothetical protein